ncbi:V-type ATP synthase subunit I [Candidatus Poribacteria bacterium]
MFRPEKMSFVNISVMDEYLTQVLDRLAKLGVMHVVDKAELPSSTESLEDIDIGPVRSKLGSLRGRVEELLTTLSVVVGFTSISAGVSKDKITVDPFHITDEIESELSDIETAVRPVIQRRTQIQLEISTLEEESHQLSAFEVQGVNVEDLKEARFLYMAFGDVPVEYYERLASSLVNAPCVLSPGETIADRQQILAFSLMSDREIISNALEAAYFSRAKIPDKYQGDVAGVLDEIELEIWARREEMAELRGEMRSLRERWSDRLLELNSTIAANQIVIESVERFGKAGESYFLSGWVPCNDVEELQAELEEITNDGVLVDASEPISAQEAEHHNPKVPTKLKHPFFLRPFTGLVTNFGIPRYSGIDPTPLASLAFLAMFGIMFADVGHGGVLLTLGLFGFFYPPLRQMRQMASFLACCGGASIVFGFVFGSVFGKEEIIKPLWFSLEHMENPEAVKRMLKLGVYFGIGILSLGVLLNIIQSFRRKDFKEAFCGQWGIFSLMFYWIAAYLVILAAMGREVSLRWILIVVSLLLPILLKEPLSRLIGRKHGHEEEEEGESVIEAGFEIYEIAMAYLANTLSYIRMAAFNLSHAGLMMASYQLTEELGGGGSLLLSLPSNIMANAFVIALEGLIVAIQCMRLEYYEFFSKFFAGEGVEYKPMKIE